MAYIGGSEYQVFVRAARARVCVKPTNPASRSSLDHTFCLYQFTYASVCVCSCVFDVHSSKMACDWWIPFVKQPANPFLVDWQWNVNIVSVSKSISISVSYMNCYMQTAIYFCSPLTLCLFLPCSDKHIHTYSIHRHTYTWLVCLFVFRERKFIILLFFAYLPHIRHGMLLNLAYFHSYGNLVNRFSSSTNCSHRWR